MANTRSPDVVLGITPHSIRQAVMATPEAAEYIGFAVSTLKLWRRQGRGPRFVRTRGRIVYRIVDLDAWLFDHLVGGDT